LPKKNPKYNENKIIALWIDHAFVCGVRVKSDPLFFLARAGDHARQRFDAALADYFTGGGE
jgi:hypothetical protein